MKTAYCLLNHELTKNQIEELKEKFNVEKIVYPDEALSYAWAQIPATPVLDTTAVSTAVNWLASSSVNDILIVQGEFGSTFMLADYALNHGVVPLYAVTKRVASEKRDGEKVNRQYVFEHVCFRGYTYFTDFLGKR